MAHQISNKSVKRYVSTIPARDWRFGPCDSDRIRTETLCDNDTTRSALKSADVKEPR